MSKLPYMPLWVDAYLGDTTHLTAEESGAYLHLLMSMWRHNGSIPNDDKDLCRIAKVAPARWSRVKARIMPLMRVREDGRLTQKRLAELRNRVSASLSHDTRNHESAGVPTCNDIKGLEQPLNLIQNQSQNKSQKEEEKKDSRGSDEPAADAANKVVSLPARGESLSFQTKKGTLFVPAGKDMEGQCFALADQILGPRTGGMVAKLAKIFRYDWKAVRKVILTAHDKHDPKAWVGRYFQDSDLAVEEFYAGWGAH